MMWFCTARLCSFIMRNLWTFHSGKLIYLWNNLFQKDVFIVIDIKEFLCVLPINKDLKNFKKKKDFNIYLWFFNHITFDLYYLAINPVNFKSSSILLWSTYVKNNFLICEVFYVIGLLKKIIFIYWFMK